MVTPVTGPFISLYHPTVPPRAIWDYRNWYRQHKPYDRPLPLIRASGVQHWNDASVWLPFEAGLYSSLISSDGAPSVSFPSARRARFAAYQVGYDRFVSRIKAGKSASLGVTLAEISESAHMIQARAHSLVNSVIAVKNRDFGLLYRSLFLDKSGRDKARKIVTKKKVLRDFSSVYLELIFGWRPLVEDIGSCVEVLQRGFRTGKIVSKAKFEFHDEDPLFLGFANGTIAARFEAWIKTSNPNIRLANELGFINPAQVAWDVIPFSFLVNWFVPVSQFLGSYSAFWGIELSNASITYLTNVESSSFTFSTPVTGMMFGYKVERELYASPPVPKFTSRIRLKDANLFGKAASSVALLIQQLTQRGK